MLVKSYKKKLQNPVTENSAERRKLFYADILSQVILKRKGIAHPKAEDTHLSFGH